MAVGIFIAAISFGVSAWVNHEMDLRATLLNPETGQIEPNGEIHILLQVCSECFYHGCLSSCF